MFGEKTYKIDLPASTVEFIYKQLALENLQNPSAKCFEALNQLYSAMLDIQENEGGKK